MVNCSSLESLVVFAVVVVCVGGGRELFTSLIHSLKKIQAAISVLSPFR